MARYCCGVRYGFGTADIRSPLCGILPRRPGGPARWHASSCPHPLDQHPRRLRPHDAVVWQLALAQLLAQLAAADRHLLVSLRSAFLDQPDPAQLLIERCEADLDR